MASHIVRLKALVVEVAKWCLLWFSQAASKPKWITASESVITKTRQRYSNFFYPVTICCIPPAVQTGSTYRVAVWGTPFVSTISDNSKFLIDLPAPRAVCNHLSSVCHPIHSGSIMDASLHLPVEPSAPAGVRHTGGRWKYRGRRKDERCTLYPPHVLVLLRTKFNACIAERKGRSHGGGFSVWPR